MIVLCKNCNFEFNRPACHIKRVNNVFCSIACHNSYQRCQSIISGKSIKKQCKVCGNMFAINKCYQERFSTCGTKCYFIAKRKENNGNWRGGASNKRILSTVVYKEWRKSVFERDNYTCVACHKRGGNICADHIKGWTHYPELRYKLDNGRTLCLKCHKLTYYYNIRRKLSNEQAIRIVCEFRNGRSMKDLAVEFRVSISTISRITMYKIYRHATSDLFGEKFPKTSEERLGL